MSETTKNPDLRKDFESLISNYLNRENNLDGRVTKGKVIDIDRDAAIVDVNLKSEGRIPLKEFEGGTINIGDIVDVYILQYEGQMGDVRISHERAHQEAIWKSLDDSLQNHTPIEGTITAQVKGGMSVNIQGIIAFLPGSQIDVRPTKDSSNFVDITCEFIVIKVDRRRHNIVVSRRAFLEKSRSSKREKILTSIEQGQRIKGVVKNITDYGAFIDLGGIDGLLHISDISWKRISKITDDILRIDQEIDVVVTRINKESQRISLGIKQLENDPWDNIHDRIKEGDIVEGEICNIREYGAFVRLDSGLEGLAHANNLVWCKRSPKPEEVFSVGQRVKSKILEISDETRRISLGIKECTDNPLIAFAENHPTGTVIPITVKEVTDFGLIVEITKDIDSTVPKIALPDGQEDMASRYEAGKVLQAKILKIIPEKEFISLDLSQDKNTWKSRLGDIKKDDVVQITVSAISEKSIHVAVTQDIQSEIFSSNLSVDKDLQDPRRFHIGQEMKAKVISIDARNKKVGLSIRALEEDNERLALQEYERDQKRESNTSLGKAFEEAEKRRKE